MITPVRDKVWIERDPAKSEVGMIAIPESAQALERTGKVFRSGPMVREVAPGQRVMFQLGTGRIMEYRGREYLIIREKEVLGIVD